MRNLFTSFLTLALAFSISTATFATNADTNLITNDGSKDTSITVNATYRDSSTDVISVDIAWDRMDFTYTAEGSWDPKTHSISTFGTGFWSWNGMADGNSTPTITVTNHSNTGVKAQFEFTPAVFGLNGTFTGLTDGVLTLATAEKTTPANAPSKSTSFSISGSGINENKSSLGTITVNVSKNDTDSDDDGVIKVSTVDELLEAIEYVDNKYVKLESDITLTRALVIHGQEVGNGNVIDLNGHTISCSDELLKQQDSAKIVIQSFHNSLITIKNGIFRIPFKSDQSASIILFTYEGSARFEDCTFIGETADIAYLETSTVTFHNCSFSLDDPYFMSLTKNANLIFSGNTRSNRNAIEFITQYPPYTITYLAGTYNFDPTKYVDTSNFTVTNDGNGIWTVTEN